MNTTNDREKVLHSIREGLKQADFKKIEETSIGNKEIFNTQDKPLIDIFKEELTEIKGECIFFKEDDELSEYLKSIHSRENLELCYCPDPKYHELIKRTQISFTSTFENTDAIKSGISSCEFLVARFGSVMVSSALPGGRRIFSFPEIHMVIADESQLVLELEDALNGIMLKYGDNLPSQIINITGPSRTADIEKTLILGAHGPKQLIVFVRKT